MARLLLTSSLVLVAGCGAPSAETPSPAPASEISGADAVRTGTPPLTPDGWGPLRIGMSRAEVVAAVGEDRNPEAVGGPDPSTCDEFRPQQAPEAMLVMIERDRLTRISLTAPSEVAAQGAHRIGDPADQIAQSYGPAARREPHKYEPAPSAYITIWSRGGAPGYVQDPQARGLVFEIGQDGAVQAIRAGGPSIQYVEGCA
jgi:hypothetical protein